MGETTKPTPKKTSKTRKTVTATTASAHQAADQALDLERIFPGESEMARLMRAFDWAQTPLGPAQEWSVSLRSMVSFLLANRFPLLLWWGPEFLQLYNDAYRPVLGAKHPQYLGRSVRECWSEIWDVIGPLIETPFNGGPATWMEDIQLEVNRHGFFEETHFTIAYSPVPDETAPNGIGGVLATVHEISEKVVGERRVLALRDLGARSAEAKTAAEACQIAAETLAHYPKDIPFALLYLLDGDSQHARLAATAGVEENALLGPTVIDLSAGELEKAPWPLAEVIHSERMQVVHDLTSHFTTVPAGPWSDPPISAVVAPIRSNVAHRLAGVLVAGVSPRRALDDNYEGFYELVASQIATTIASARAYEEERQRAEALAEIDRAKTAFFSNVSHEFRTPLTLMLGPLEDLLAKNHQTPETHEQLDLIHRNGLRLLKLVNTLLDFSRIEAGRVQASYEPVDLATYTAELASSFRSLAGKAALSLLVDCAPLNDLRAPVYVDREMWEKIVLNLLSNAFKYTFDGGITVTLHAVNGGEGVELMVRDSGVGIPAAELPRIFERFHRVEGTRARTHEGSGIGLALTQELVRLHGGTIRIESAEGAGTTIFVRLPIGAEHLPADHIQAEGTPISTALSADSYVLEAGRWLPEELPGADEDSAAVEEFSGPRAVAARENNQPARIVLADDNADMREYLRRLLAVGYTVEAVPNGAAALAAIHREAPDLVLTDVMMPELDGFGLLRALRDDPRTATLPVILLSARAGEEATLEGLAAGADDYLVKPFSAQEVLSRVAARLEIAHVRNEAIKTGQQLKAIIEAVPDSVTVYDTEGRVITANAAFRSTLARFIPIDPPATLRERMARHPLRGMTDEILPEEEWPQTRLLKGETLSGPTVAEAMMYAPDGEAVYWNVTGAPLQTEDGRIVGAVAIHRDVTAQKRLEHDLRQSRDELQAILEAVPDQVIVYDSNLHLVRSNAAHRAAEQRYYPGEPAPGELSERIQRTRTVFRDLNGAPLPEGDWPQRRILRGETLSGSSAVETQATTHEGKAQWWSVSGAPLQAEDGTITGAVLVNTDITQRKELEEALRRANERFAIAERAANGFVYEWDVRAGAVYRSAGFERLLGYRPGEIPPTWTAWAQLVYPGDWQVRTDADALAYVQALHGETLESEYRVRHREGHYLTVAEHALIERDADGNVTRLIGQTHDITERKRMERLLAEQKRLLELIAAGRPLDNFLTALTNAVARLEPGARAAILVADAARTKFQTISAAAIPSSFGEGLKDTPIDDRTDRTIYSGQPVTCVDIARDERWSQIFRNQCLAHGILACHSEPVIDSGGAQLASLMLCFDAPRTPSDWELRIAQVGARLLSIAIERGKAEAGIQRANIRFQLAEQAANGFVFEWDVRTDEVYRSEGLTAILGYQPEEIAPGWEGWTSLIHPEDVLAKTKAEALAYLQTLPDGTLQNEYRVRHRDGYYIPVAEHILIDRDERGEIVRLIGQTNDITERKRAEARLRASENRYRILFSLAPVAVYSCDADGVIVEFNQRAAELWGRSPERNDPRERYCGSYRIFHPNGRFMPHAECPMARVLRGETLAEGEREILVERPDGARKSVIAHPEALRNERGEIIGAINSLYDVTERKELEAELRASEERFRGIVETASEGVWLVDMLGRTVYANERIAALLGYQVAELTGRPITDFVFPEDVELAQSYIGGNLRGRTEQFDFRLRRRNGEAILVLVGTSPVHDATGEIVGALGMFSDITERQRTEAASAHLAAIVESADDAIVSKTLEGIVTTWNASAERMFGYTAQEMIGQSIRRLIPLERQHEEDEILASIGAGERIQHFETARVRKDGQRLEVSLTISPIRDGTGAIVGASKIARDITERRRLEYAVAERASLLEAVFAAAPSRISIFDESGQMVRLNPAAQQIAGPERERASIETVGEAFDLRTVDGDRFPPEELPTARALRGEIVQGVEMVLRDAEQHDQYILTSSAPFYDLTGELRGAVALAHDVTALRRAEREAATWAAQLDATFDSLTDGLFIYDAAGQLARMNDAARTILALDAAPDYYSLTPEERTARMRVRDANDRLLAPEEWGLGGLAKGGRLEEPVELRITALDGTTKDLAITGGPVRDRDGNVTGTVALLRDVTESRRLQLAVTEQASQLQATFDSLAEPMCVFDAKGRILRQNEAERTMFGFDTPPATVEERAARIQLRSAEGLLLSPEEMPGREVLAGETLVGGDMVETLARGADGHDHWFSVTGAPICSDAGKIIGGVIAYRDVTERRSLEREIEERAGLLQTTFDSMTDGVLILDVDGAARACNGAYRTLMGYDPVTEERRLSADARRKRFRARDANGKPFSPESWPLTRVLRGETITHESAVDLYIRARNGRKIIVSMTGAPLRTFDGALIGALVVMRDVTTQRALQRETRWQASMLERAHDAIFMWELDGPILYWNHGAELLYGYSSEEAVGQISQQLLQTERPVTPELFKKALKRNGEWIGDILHTTRDGRSLVTESRHQLLKEPGGKAIVLEVCRDITERLELEQELRRSHDELEQRVHERTRELAGANRSLRRLSRQVMEVQETERRRIARELHDEIGQALTGVKMMIETAARRTGTNGANTNGANTTERQGSALDVREAIDDALSRVRELSLDLRPAMLDSLGLLPTLLWRFENYTSQTGIQVEFHHIGLDQRFAPEVETGAYRIVQEALTNVARHAAVPIVRVQVMAADTMLHIYIIDEGAGFEAEEAIAAGLSTGLVGMRERATLLGGVFLVSSTPGGGTTIEVELPLSPGGEVESDRDAARDAERDEVRDAQRDAARDLARDAVRDATRDMARDVAHDANRDRGEEGEP
ncbi:MAG TPA: PAS domain S-box protein [Ktedonobacterales bacterium]